VLSETSITLFDPLQGLCYVMILCDTFVWACVLAWAGMPCRLVKFVDVLYLTIVWCRWSFIYKAELIALCLLFSVGMYASILKDLKLVTSSVLQVMIFA
jgi:hypothetical protein